MTTNQTPIRTIDQLVERIKADIIFEMNAGYIPPSVRSFGELHDYCDANCLGGLCDDKIADDMIAHFGGRDKHEGMPEAMLALINAAQSQINTWLDQRHATMHGAVSIPIFTSMAIAEFDLSDVVGDYDDATTTTEGIWLQDNASYRHRGNGEDGTLDFVVNLAVVYDDVPPRLADVFAHAHKARLSYLVVHAGA